MLCLAQRYVKGLFLMLLVGIKVLAGLSMRESNASYSAAGCPPGKFVSKCHAYGCVPVCLSVCMSVCLSV